MLQIKQKLHLTLPHLPAIWTRSLQFSKIEPEKDELIAAIDDEMSASDDDWQLVERPDTKELAQFWDKVEDDILHDPKWIQIDD